MRNHRYCRWLLGALAGAAGGLAGAGVVTPELVLEMARHAPGDRIPIIVQLAERVDILSFAPQDGRRSHTTLMSALKAQSALGLPRLKALLDRNRATDRKPLWINNAIAVTVPVRAIDALARDSAVGRIQYDAIVPFAAPAPAPAASVASSTRGAGWNIEAVQAPALWSLGARGAGVVVANMDTGVDLVHPDLQGRWRGGSNSWFDPSHQHDAPYDANGHGTQTMGLIVGGTAGGAAIGIAPAAKWIAVRIFNDAGLATLSNIHLAFQWLLDPDGDPATNDAPDVVNASWGLTGGAAGACNMEFNDDIQALSTAGTAVVFAAGNDGPAPASSTSPAANPASLSVGTLDETLGVSGQSSRGPSGCGGAIFPSIAAPGINVVSSDLSFGGLARFATVSGTSFAAPHVTGAIALLASAFPAATVTALKNAVIASAADVDLPGPDNNTGYGLINVLAAYQLLAKGNGSQAGTW